MSDTDLRSPFGKTLTIVVGGMLGVLVGFAVFGGGDEEALKPKQDAKCEGTPIRVDRPYYGGMLEPHDCKQQCDDGIQHYLLYSNGKATQCQILPGCLDWGEDQGVTCKP